jgi:hypothetical protein
VRMNITLGLRAPLTAPSPVAALDGQNRRSGGAYRSSDILWCSYQPRGGPRSLHVVASRSMQKEKTIARCPVCVCSCWHWPSVQTSSSTGTSLATCLTASARCPAAERECCSREIVQWRCPCALSGWKPRHGRAAVCMLSPLLAHSAPSAPATSAPADRYAARPVSSSTMR